MPLYAKDLTEAVSYKSLNHNKRMGERRAKEVFMSEQAPELAKDASNAGRAAHMARAAGLWRVRRLPSRIRKVGKTVVRLVCKPIRRISIQKT